MKSNIVVSVLTLLLMPILLRAQTGITGSAHDFSGQGWGTTEICEPCHTPHNSDASISDAPLWNHQSTTTVFTLYSSSTLTTTSLTQPDASSKLCLSCHDGTVALDAFGGNPGTSGNTITGQANLGTSLADDHPVSFTYNTALATADGGLYDPATHVTSLGGTIDNDLLIGGKLQCASCHDVHNGFNNPDLLKISNDGSEFCLTCHNK